MQRSSLSLHVLRAITISCKDMTKDGLINETRYQKQIKSVWINFLPRACTTWKDIKQSEKTWSPS